MWCNQIFSLIEETGEIKNIIVCDNYETANEIARIQYGDNAYAVDTTQYPVSMGDQYKEGLFYTKEGIEVPRNNTAEEDAKEANARSRELKQELETTEEKLLQTQLALIEEYEKKEELKDSITQLQLGLVNLYERKENV